MQPRHDYPKQKDFRRSLLNISCVAGDVGLVWNTMFINLNILKGKLRGLGISEINGSIVNMSKSQDKNLPLRQF